MADPLWGESEIDLTETRSQADAGAAIRLALKRLSPVLTSQSVQADVAAPSGLLVQMRAAALADLLEELLASAVHSAPASRMLLTAAAQGDHVEIGITDDMPGADLSVRTASLRGLMARVAMQGGILDVGVRCTEGTTITLRLAALNRARQSETDVLLPEAAREKTSANPVDAS